MTSDLPRASVLEFSLRVASRMAGNDWSVLVVPEGVSTSSIAKEIADHLAALAELDAVVMATASPSECSELLGQSTAVTVIVAPVGWHAAQWRWLDEHRAEFSGPRGLVLVVTDQEALTFARSAPHVMSWVGSEFHRLDMHAGELSPEERDARLEALRGQTGLRDDDVVARAQDGTLSGDPLYGEWLILLGRGDLL